MSDVIDLSAERDRRSVIQLDDLQEEGDVVTWVAIALVYARLPVRLRDNLRREVEDIPDMIWGDYIEEARAIISISRGEG